MSKNPRHRLSLRRMEKLPRQRSVARSVALGRSPRFRSRLEDFVCSEINQRTIGVVFLLATTRRKLANPKGGGPFEPTNPSMRTVPAIVAVTSRFPEESSLVPSELKPNSSHECEGRPEASNRPVATSKSRISWSISSVSRRRPSGVKAAIFTPPTEMGRVAMRP